MEGIDPRQVVHAPARAPVGEVANGPVVSPPRIFVADIGGEEIEEEFGCFGVWQEERGRGSGERSHATRQGGNEVWFHGIIHRRLDGLLYESGRALFTPTGLLLAGC